MILNNERSWVMANSEKEKNNRRILMQGNIAVAEGAYRAGCRFFGEYPITPSK
jgi:hypothetical protein